MNCGYCNFYLRPDEALVAIPVSGPPQTLHTGCAPSFDPEDTDRPRFFEIKSNHYVGAFLAKWWTDQSFKSELELILGRSGVWAGLKILLETTE